MTLIRRGEIFKRRLDFATMFLSPYTSPGREYQTPTVSFVLLTIQKSGVGQHCTFQPSPMYVFSHNR